MHFNSWLVLLERSFLFACRYMLESSKKVIWSMQKKKIEKASLESLCSENIALFLSFSRKRLFSRALWQSTSRFLVASDSRAMQKSSKVKGDSRKVLENCCRASYISSAGKIKDFSKRISEEDGSESGSCVLILCLFLVNFHWFPKD